jgi:Holliday junction resolvase RusA-like endonuclease
MESLNLEKITYPVTINYNFYRPDRRKTDMENKISSIQDMFVKAWLIEDDSWEFIPQMTSHSIEVDKTNPRVEIFITKYPYYES